ncbi:DUF1580 domain-containing protein [Schlesneria paludicola]|uniref:DUF1580 domain-containing protein n=1 Tax=Schlesneria paludicola TaxID=360056 RepID=UPI00029B10BD|nr:DUF1580 domain-containing protein [Schlesneria paludicola]
MIAIKPSNQPDVIDIEHETIIGLFEIPKHCPGPRKPSRATAFRWALDGLRIAGTDQRVKLPTLKLNGIRCTSVEALHRFLRMANGQAQPAGLTAQQRRKQAELANRLLESSGY